MLNLFLLVFFGGLSAALSRVMYAASEGWEHRDEVDEFLRTFFWVSGIVLTIVSLILHFFTVLQIAGVVRACIR